MSIETYQGNSNGYGVASYQSQSAELAKPKTLSRLLEWAQAAQAAHQVAENLVQTSFVPVQFRGKAHEATAAILAGDEVGLSPIASLNAFDIIQGSAAAKAMTLRAIVQSHGHEVWHIEATDSRAIFKGRRKGSEEIHESVWTIERARGLGLLNKNEWKKQPKAMLIARATSEVCRLTAADAILGIPYSAEELRDGVTPEWQPPTDTPQGESAAPADAPVPAPRTAQRRSKPRTAPAKQATPAAQAPPAQQAEPQGPPLPGEDGYDEPRQDPGEPGEEKVNKAQLTKLATVFTTGGVSNRDTRLKACCLIVGRDISSSTELTKAEAIRLIDQVERWANEGVLAETVAELVEDAEAAEGEPSGGEQE